MSQDARAYQGKTAYRGLTDDGRKLWQFSQSDIKAVEICPERGRRSLLKLTPWTNKDNTAQGTAVHLAIELCLQSIINGQGPLGYWDMVTLAMYEFDELMAEPGSQWVKVQRRSTVEGYVEKILLAFCQQVLPTLSPQAVELHLGPHTIYEDELRVIQLEGTADYLDSIAGLGDWKTAGRRWEAREHQKWDVQPTVYTCLLWLNGGIEVGQIPWTWHVFYTNGEYESISTSRGSGDWAWLKERCYGLALQLEAELPVWFKNDTSWLCSAKYCDAWTECKGAALERGH